MSFYEIMTLVGALVITLLMLALVYYASRWYAKRMGTSSGRYVKVLEKAVLGQNSAVYVVKAGRRCFLLGVADKGVTRIAELDDFNDGDMATTGAVPFSGALSEAINKQNKQRGHKGR